MRAIHDHLATLEMQGSGFVMRQTWKKQSTETAFEQGRRWGHGIATGQIHVDEVTLVIDLLPFWDSDWLAGIIYELARLARLNHGVTAPEAKNGT